MSWEVLAASTAGHFIKNLANDPAVREVARKAANLGASTIWKEKVEPAAKRTGLDHELAGAYKAGFNAFVGALRQSFDLDGTLEERLRVMFADEGFQDVLAELPRSRFEDVDASRARDLFLGLGLPGATAEDFDFPWRSLGRRFRDAIAGTKHAAELAGLEQQDRIESYLQRLVELAENQSPRRDDDDVLAAYREYVDRQHRLADTRGLFWREKETTGEAIRLHEIFVETQLQRQDGRERVLEPEDGERQPDDGERPLMFRQVREDPRPVADVLARERRLVVLGPPGSGKSTLVQCLALALATEDDPPLSTGLPAETVPILLPLRTYAASLKQQANLRLDAFLGEQLEQQLPNVHAILESGNALVLLDGLDEVFDDTHRRWVSDETWRLMNTYSRSRFVLTSRPHGYQAAPLPGGVPLYELVAFDEERIRRFFHGWFTALERQELDVEHGRTAEQRANELADNVLERERIRTLAENPMLCTLIVMVHRSRSGRLPERRVDFYEAAVSVLTERWERYKRHPKQEGELNYPEPKTMKGVLAEVAWRAQTELKEREIPEDVLSTWMREALKDDPEWSGQRKNAVRDLLRVVQERTGLLTDAGGNRYQFVHLSLQEYLVAFYMLDRLDDGQCCRVLRYFVHAPEWEEILRLAIAAAPRTRADALVKAILDEPTSEWEEISRRDLRFLCRCMQDRPDVSEGVLGEVRSLWLKTLEERSYDDEEALIRDGVGLSVTPATRTLFETRLDADDNNLRKSALLYFMLNDVADVQVRDKAKALIQDLPSSVRRAAVNFFASSTAYSEGVELLFDNEDVVFGLRDSAVHYLKECVKRNPAAASKIKSMATSENIEARRLACDYFSGEQMDDCEVTAIFDDFLVGKDRREQLRALNYFGSIGTRSDRLVNIAMDFLESRDDLEQSDAIEYLTNIGYDSEDARVAVLKVLEEAKMIASLKVPKYFAKICPADEEIRRLFESFLLHDSYSYRFAAATYLVDSNFDDEERTAAIFKCLKDKDSLVRGLAINHLADSELGSDILREIVGAIDEGAYMLVSANTKRRLSISLGRQVALALDGETLDTISRKWFSDYMSVICFAAAGQRDGVYRKHIPLARILNPSEDPVAANTPGTTMLFEEFLKWRRSQAGKDGTT